MKKFLILLLLAVLPSTAFSQALPGTPVSGPIVPRDATHTYPTLDPTYMLGGWRTVTNIGPAAITSPRLQYGMVVYQQNTNALWFYNTNATWSLLSSVLEKNIGNTDLTLSGNRTLSGNTNMLTFQDLLGFNVDGPVTIGNYAAGNLVLHVDDNIEDGAYPQFSNNSGALRTARPVTVANAEWSDGDAYTAVDPKPDWFTALQIEQGAIAVITPDANNSGATTLDVNGKIHPIVRASGTPLEADDLVANNPAILVFGSATGWRLIGAASGGGPAPASGVPVFNNVADLIASGAGTELAYIRGHTIPGDGGGGFMTYVLEDPDDIVNYGVLPSGSSYRRLEFDVTRVYKAAWAGMKADDVTPQDTNMAKFIAKVSGASYERSVIIEFGPGTYYFTNTLDFRAYSDGSVTLRGTEPQRGAFAESQQSSFATTKFRFNPLSSTNYCLKMGPQDNAGLWGGRANVENIHFKGSYGLICVGDPNRKTYGPNGEFNVVGGQRYAHQVTIKGCAFENAVVSPYAGLALSTAIADSIMVQIVGAYEPHIENCHFEGGGTQLKLLTCDQVSVDNCRFLQGHIGVWQDGKAKDESFTTSTPVIVHNCEFESWHLAAVVGHGNLQVNGGGMERNSAAFATGVGEGLTPIQAGVSVTLTNSITFSAAQDDNLRAYISVLALTNASSGVITYGMVKSVSGTTVVLDETNISLASGTYNIGRVHGAGVVSTKASGFQQSATITNMRYQGYNNAPSFVWSPGIGSMYLNGIHSETAYGYSFFPTIVIGNRLSSHAYGQNTFVHVGSVADHVSPDPQHPLVRSHARSDLRQWVGYQNDEHNKPGNRDPSFGKRTWTYNAKGGVHLQSFPSVVYEQVAGEGNTSQTFWAMRLDVGTATGLLFIDRTLPTATNRMYRVRVWAKPASGTPLLTVGFEGISFVVPINAVAMSTEWAAYDYIGQLPTPWTAGAGRVPSTDSAIRVNCTGTGSVYVDSVIVEPLDVYGNCHVVYTQPFNASFTPDVRQGSTVRTTATSAFTLNLPSGMTAADDGMIYRLQVKHSGGSWGITFDANYDLGDSIRFYEPSPSGKTDLLSFQYNHASGKWICVGVLFGYSL